MNDEDALDRIAELIYCVYPISTWESFPNNIDELVEAVRLVVEYEQDSDHTLIEIARLVGACPGENDDIIAGVKLLKTRAGRKFRRTKRSKHTKLIFSVSQTALKYRLT